MGCPPYRRLLLLGIVAMSLKTLLISGGSASGKTWLTQRLAAEIPGVTLVCQDAFYHDRPSGNADDRHEFDFDQPYAIDWAEMATAVKALRSGQGADVPIYDFTVSLRAGSERVEPTGDTLIVDGTLVMGQPDMVALADVCVYVRCPEVLRRARREQRDVKDRGRDIEFVRKQLDEQVFPAHEQHVRPSAQHADLILDAQDIVAHPEVAVKQVLELLERTS